MGLDIYLEWHGQTKAEHDAQIAARPGKGGEVGYLRSNYNDGGFNGWARRTLGVEGFYHIFGCTFQDVPNRRVMGPDGDPLKEAWTETGLEGVPGRDWDYVKGFFPDWQASRARAQELLRRAEALDHLYLIRVSSPVLPTSCEYLKLGEVLDTYRQTVAKHEAYTHLPEDYAKDGWSNWQGDWMPHDSPTVRAVLWTLNDGLFEDRLQPVLVCESEKNPHAWYIRAIADCLRFIDVGERRDGWLRWSS